MGTLGRFCLIIFFLSPSIFAQSNCPLSCGPQTTPILISAMSTCEWELKALGCEKVEPKHSVKTCCEEDLLAPQKSWLQHLKSCHAGAVGATTDYFEWILGSLANKKRWYQECQRECKRKLTQGDPYFDSMSDEKIEKMHIVNLEHIFIQRQNSLQKHNQIMKAMRFDPHKRNSESQVLESPQNAFAMKALYYSAESFVKSQYQKMNCLKPEAITEMVCYGVMSLVDPTMAVGMLYKAPHLATRLSRGGAPPSSDFLRPQHGVFRESVERELFLRRQLNKSFTSVEQNQEWIKMARSTKPESGSLFFESENAVLRDLNKRLNDKNLVTSITHQHQEYMKDMFSGLSGKWQEQIEFFPYSDYKSFRMGFKPKPPLKKIPPEFEAELRASYEIANQKFSNFLVHNNLILESENPKTWFRSGLGTTADEASVATRTSRNRTEENVMLSFQDPDVKNNLEALRGWSEIARQDIVSNLKGVNLISRTASGVDLPRDEVLELLRKTNDPEKFRKTLSDTIAYNDPLLKKQINEKINDTVFAQLQRYKDMVDHFSPSLRNAERKVTSLEGADQGGMTADFAGLGAQNLKATAEAVSLSKDLKSALQLSREAEEAVTRKFDAQMTEFNSIVEQYMPKTVASGDDFSASALRPLTQEQKQNLVNEAAQQPTLTQKRIAFIDSKSNPADRNILADHGETLEQELRTQLAGKIDPRKLKSVNFALDMKGSAVGNGEVSLFIGQSKAANLSDQEIGEIKTAFKNAVREFNSKPDPDGVQRKYKAK